MGIKKILEQLKKEKNKLDYLEKELKKTEDKKLKKEITESIEKLKSKKSKEGGEEKEAKVKIPSLEQIAMSIPRLQEVKTETLENYQSRRRERIMIPAQPQREETQRQTNYSEDYGSNIKSDYMRTKADFDRQLEVSGLTTRTGFTTTAESKHAIQQKAGDKREYMQAGDNLNIQQYNIREEMLREDLTGLSHDLKQAKRGRREIEVYHG